MKNRMGVTGVDDSRGPGGTQLWGCIYGSTQEYTVAERGIAKTHLMQNNNNVALLCHFRYTNCAYGGGTHMLDR